MTRSSRATWTAAAMGDLTGKTAVVTGANSGIGLEATRELLRHGAAVVLACRSEERAAAALDDLARDVPVDAATVVALDLADLSSVRSFPERLGGRAGQLDLLLNNAGIMMVPYGRTADGFERQVGTNHLGHFALTGLLLDRLAAAPAARVVTVSSVGHRGGRLPLDDLLFEQGRYSPFAAYARSKLANLLFAYELDRRLRAAGSTTISLAAHPGLSSTHLADHLYRWVPGPLVTLVDKTMQPASAGALPLLRAATDPDLRGGEYLGPGGFLEQRGAPVVVTSSQASHDHELARRLWERSEELTDVRVAIG